jgi:hypothetical protein
LELTVEDVRSMVGGYVLELIGKEKEIAQLKAEIERLKTEGKDRPRDIKEVASISDARAGN